MANHFAAQKEDKYSVQKSNDPFRTATFNTADSSWKRNARIEQILSWSFIYLIIHTRLSCSTSTCLLAKAGLWCTSQL